MRQLLMRQMLPLGLTISLTWLLWDRISSLDLAVIGTGFRTVSVEQWVTAALFSVVSFWAVGNYDAVVHRLIRTKIDAPRARRSGFAAIAVAQTVGFGVLTSALVRWRLLPELSLTQSLRMGVTVAVSFLAGWAVVTALVALFFPLAIPASGAVAGLVLIIALVLVGLSLWRPAFLGRWAIPSVASMSVILFLTFVDTVAAGLALHALLPGGMPIAPAPFVAAFLVALGVGLVSGTPGGVGPFEVTLLALLPGHADEPILGAVLAFRLVYFAIPAVIGAALVIRGPRTVRSAFNRPASSITGLTGLPHLSTNLSDTIQTAPRAETALLRQGHLSVFNGPTGQADAMVLPAGQSLVLLSDPFRASQSPGPLLNCLGTQAHQRFLVPFLYKSGGRLAATARRAGWHVAPIAREAWLDPQKFSPQGRAFRQLRRKLRKAETAGVVITQAGTDLPFAQMDAISAQWARTHGGERGFSMGRYSRATLRWSRVFLAHQNGRLVGFATLHTNAGEWTLDLMRQAQGAPDGVMHLLVARAISDAAQAACPRFSLAAVPLGRQNDEPFLHSALRSALDKITGAAGLRQFKAAFDPCWETLYMAAPTRRALVLGALDVMREIARPPRINPNPEIARDSSSS